VAGQGSLGPKVPPWPEYVPPDGADFIAVIQAPAAGTAVVAEAGAW